MVGCESARIGAVLYLRVADHERLQLMKKAVVESKGLIAGVQVHCYDVMNPETARFSTRKFAPSTLKRIESEYASGVFDVANFYDRSIRASVPSDEPIFILSIDGQAYEGVRPVSIMIPSHLFNQEAALTYLQELISEFGADYGCICSGSDRYVESVISLVPIGRPGVWGLEPGDPEYDFEQELLLYQGHRKSLGERVPRACWGNILSPVHVEALGGEDRIRKESGCYLVERWGKNLYLQLTESPWDVSKAQLVALNGFLQSIRFPGAPEPIYLEEP